MANLTSVSLLLLVRVVLPTMRAVATLARRAVGRPAVLARSYTRSVARLGGLYSFATYYYRLSAHVWVSSS